MNVSIQASYQLAIKWTNTNSKESAKKIVKIIKESGIKVQASIMDEQVRVNGKKLDDLQQVIALVRSQAMELPLQYINFRDWFLVAGHKYQVACSCAGLYCSLWL